MDNFDPSTQIAIIWCIKDVQSVREDLTDEQAMKVLESVKNHHDANIGVSWEVIEIHADMLYPEV